MSYGIRKPRPDPTNWEALFRASLRGSVKTLQDYRVKGFQGSTESRARWIVIGRLTMEHYVRRGNCGFPGGHLMTWQGRITPGTPWEFLRWDEVFFATRRRLQLRGLQMKAIALDARRDGLQVAVHVLVERVKEFKG